MPTRLVHTGSHPQPPSRRLAGFAWCTAALLLPVAGVLLLYLRRFQLPAPTGPYSVGTEILDLTDLDRPDPYLADRASRRELVVQLWYPAAPSQHSVVPYIRWREAGLEKFYGPFLRTHSRLKAPVAQAVSPYPVLLFSHRWGGQRTQNTVLAEDLASHGYVVASIDYPHNAARTLLANGTVVRGHQYLEGPRGASATSGEQIAFWDETLRIWAADERFVLDQLEKRSADPASPFYGRLDTQHAGAFGHSFGGAAALALCGLDPRIRSAANLDGWTFTGLQHRTAAQPILLAYEGASVLREQQLANNPPSAAEAGSTQDQLDRFDFASTEQSIRAFGGYRVFLAGTQHMDFSDQPLLPPFRRLAYTGPTPPREVNAILRQVLLQFFDSTLRGKQAPILTPGETSLPELTVERWLPASPGTPPRP